MCSQVYKRSRFQKIKDRDAFTVLGRRKERIIMQVSAIIEPGTTTWYFSYSSTEIHSMINNIT